MPVYLSVYIYVCLSIYLPAYMSACLALYLCSSLPVYLSACLVVCLPSCLSVRLAVYLAGQHKLSGRSVTSRYWQRFTKKVPTYIQDDDQQMLFYDRQVIRLAFVARRYVQRYDSMHASTQARSYTHVHRHASTHGTAVELLNTNRKHG